jgi:hypothetical protein
VYSYSVKAHKTMMNAIDGCGGANIGTSISILLVTTQP